MSINILEYYLMEKKMFYNSASDYFKHTGKTIKFYDEYKVKDNYIFTDVKGVEIYQY